MFFIKKGISREVLKNSLSRLMPFLIRERKNRSATGIFSINANDPANGQSSRPS